MKKEKYCMEIPKRKNNRLTDYDYRTYGGYFVTICTAERKQLFWTENGTLSQIGRIADHAILSIPNYYPTVKLEKYVIMPDHIHLLFLLENYECESAPSVSRIIKQLKSAVTKHTGYPIWQKSYYDRVVRNQEEYREIWEYIEYNPIALSLKKEM